jgi:hypothetical protein
MHRTLSGLEKLAELNDLIVRMTPSDRVIWTSLPLEHGTKGAS